MPAFIMGGNVMGTALVMEHANALAQMIVSEKDKLFDERVEALVKPVSYTHLTLPTKRIV